MISSSKRRQQNQNQQISYIDYLHETDLSQCILKDHLYPGICISTQPSSLTNIVCSCQYILPTTTSTTSTSTASTTTKQQPVSSSSTFSIPRSQLFIEKHLIPFHNQKISIQLLAEAGGGDNDGSISSNTDPSISASWNISKGFTLFTNMNTSGNGWIGSHWDTTFHLLKNDISSKNNHTEELQYNEYNNNENSLFDASSTSSSSTRLEKNVYEGLDTMNREDINIKIGTWIPLQIKQQQNQISKRYMNGYAAVNMLGATAAIHTAMSIPSSLSNSTNIDELDIRTRKYFSININDIDRPPLQITLEHDRMNHTTTTNNTTTIANYNNSNIRLIDQSHISISQVFTFDRNQYNPIDQSIPKVRNTIAWTARLSSTQYAPITTLLSSTNDDDLYLNDYSSFDSSTKNENNNNNNPSSLNSPYRRINEMSLGMAWQINRSVAFKCIICPQQNALTTAIILKRWKQPRITCSFIKTWNITTNTNRTTNIMNNSSPLVSLLSGWGIGIELEAGDYCNNPEAYYYNYHPNAKQITNTISSSLSERPQDDNVNNNNNNSSSIEGFPQTKATLPTNIELDIQRKLTVRQLEIQQQQQQQGSSK